MTRIWGLSQPHRLYEHAFFSSSTPIIITKVKTLEEAKEAIKLKSDVVLWLDVRFSLERVPFILEKSRDAAFLEMKRVEQEKHPETPIFIGARLSDYPWEQINEFYKNTPALKEFYEQFPQTRFVVNMVDNVADAHLKVVEAVEGFKPNERTLIQSDALILMTSVKDLKPEWVYGTSVPDLMRLLTLDSMYVLPATIFKGDVFIAPFTIKNRPAFNDEIIAEMHRRQKRIFLGPIQSEAQLQKAQSLNATGYITDNLPELLRLLGQGPAQ
ncbi:hypothetical protein AZI86_07515 [Bdellovibrio bacteriovorus]|uniref:Uncharacterized protein n=2 Tax=Bdellovibrio bacteriovorus TaxID=959 RepID=A0A150WT02_BDEBC|nr:hypothetical protein AZI86_07515 [Bdellovibrio bacteriovorus]